MAKTKSKFILITVFFIALQWLCTSCGEAPSDVITGKSGQAALVFVSENSRFNNRSNAMRSNVDEYYPGSDIYILEPISSQSDARNLTKAYTRNNEERPDRWGHAADPEISFDGKKILFSMKENRNSRWNLYEMNIDGTDLVQLTDDNAPGHDMDPIYLPNGQIMFASTRPQIVDEYERRQSPLIHVADRSNNQLVNIRQVSFNQSHEINPIVHSSGKIIFSRWEHLGDPNKFSIFVMNPDGTRLFVLYGNHFPSQSGSRVYHDPRELGDGGIICTLMERNSPFEGGAIVIKDLAKGDDEYKIITPDDVPFNNTNQPTSALYRSPHPIYDDGEEKIIVSISPIRIEDDNNAEDVDYGLYVMDKNGSNVRRIYNDPNFNEIDAVPVLPREELPAGMPQVIPSEEYVQQALFAKEKVGTFFDGNVYDRDPADRLLRPDANHINQDGTSGQAKFVRVLAAVGLPVDRDKRGGEIGNTNLEKQRVAGYGNIRQDGSFSIDIPANLSVHLQTCDENGMMLVSQRSWTQVMPGEKRLCTGCHDSHNRDKIIDQLDVQSDDRVQNNETGIFYKSGFNNPDNVMAHSAARTDTVDFYDRTHPYKSNTIQAIFNARCVSCHNGSTSNNVNLQMTSNDQLISGDENGNATTSVYQRLTDGNNYRGADDYVNDDGARESPLMWVMLNRQLDRDDNRDFIVPSYNHRQIWKMDGNYINPFDPQNRDLLTMIEWIDMGTQYSNSLSK